MIKASGTLAMSQFYTGDDNEWFISCRLDRKGRDDRHRSRCSVFAWLHPMDSTNVFAQRWNASDKDWKADARAVSQAALRRLCPEVLWGAVGECKLCFSAKCGCSCPCSPGFLLDRSLTDFGGAAYSLNGTTVYLDAYYMPAIAAGIATGLAAVMTWPHVEKPVSINDEENPYCAVA